MARNDPTKRMALFTGLSDAVDPVEIGLRALASAENVDIDRKYRVSRRKGTTQVYGSAVDAAWGDGFGLLFAAGGQLHSVDALEEVHTLGSLTTPQYLHGARLPHGVAITTGLETKLVPAVGDLRALGVPVPAVLSYSVLSGQGALRQGRVGLACTHFLAGAGEGGASPVSWVDVEDGDALSVTLPTLSGYRSRLYATSPDGEVLHYTGLSNSGGAVTYDGLSDRALMRPLTTAYLGVPNLPARTLATFNGRLLYAVDNMLWYSGAFAYERFNLAEGFVPMQSAINMLAPTTEGVFVGTEEAHYFLSGRDPAKWGLDFKTSYGAPLTQPVMVEKHEHGFEREEGSVYMWLSTRGVVVGFDNGNMSNITEGEVQFQRARVGSIAMHRSADLNHAVVCTRY